MMEFKFGRNPEQLFENIGLKQLREQRERTIEKWSRLGLLDGLVGVTRDNIGRMYESQTSYVINED